MISMLPELSICASKRWYIHDGTAALLTAVLATAEVQLHGAADTAITAQDHASKSGWAPDRQLLGEAMCCHGDDQQLWPGHAAIQ